MNSISTNIPAQDAIAEYLRQGGYDRHLGVLRRTLADQQKSALQALRAHLPEGAFTVTQPEGGYFLWIELPDDVDVDLLVPEATARGVAVVKGSDFLLEGGQHALRLAYSAVTADQVEEGVRRLAEAVRAVQKRD